MTLGLAVTGLLVVPISAQAAPAVGVDEVVSALGLASEPADYVVLVDTSGSMNQGGRYPAVRRELRKLLASLDSDDRVSLLAFSSKAARRYRGKVGNNPDRILAKLPATATGNHTDIGAAIAGGLTELESSDTHRLAALILITDGELDTSPGAKYANVDSSAWKKLKSRATTLAKDHDVAAYAVSLMTTTDASLLKRVLPQASEVSATEVGTRFAQVAGDLVRLRAGQALKNELTAPISVTWTGDFGAALAKGGNVPVQLAITSPYPHVPVVLSDLTMQVPDGVAVTVSGLPTKVTLEPGRTATATATVTVTGSAGANATVSLVAKVTSPWSKVLKKNFGLTFAPAIEGVAPVSPAPIQLPPSLVPVAGLVGALLAGGLLLVFLLLLVVRMIVTPSMNGVLTFFRDGNEIVDVVLRGRRLKLIAPAGASGLVGLAGAASGARGGVRLDARFGAARARGVVTDAETIQLGDLTVTYISGHRRTLDKMGLPRTGSTENQPVMSPEGGTSLADSRSPVGVTAAEFLDA